MIGGLEGGLMKPDSVVRVLLVKADFDACRWFGRWFDRWFGRWFVRWFGRCFVRWFGRWFNR